MMAVTIITYFCPITSSFSPPRFPSGFSYSSQGLSSNLSPHFFTPRLLPTSDYLISLPPASLFPIPPTPCPFFHVIPLHKKQWFPTCSHPNSYPCPSNPAPLSTQSQYLLPQIHTNTYWMPAGTGPLKMSTTLLFSMRDMWYIKRRKRSKWATSQFLNDVTRHRLLGPRGNQSNQ